MKMHLFSLNIYGFEFEIQSQLGLPMNDMLSTPNKQWWSFVCLNMKIEFSSFFFSFWIFWQIMNHHEIVPNKSKM